MDDIESVKVAVKIRPLITSEVTLGCSNCITVVPGEPQVQIGPHCFTYDYVSSGGSTTLYEDCVAPVVDSFLEGYNATVMAYGQTGSGKTFTMGTSGEEYSGAVMPKVMESIYRRVEMMKNSTEFFIRVSFVEIFNEEVFDLLDTSITASSKAAVPAKTNVPARVPIQIRETVSGGITLAGVTEAEVRTKGEMASYLSRGSLSRATASTNMNIQSSRSHAIFTIKMEQKKITHGPKGVPNGICAKLHLVDLAGSKTVKRAGADGLRLKEAININKGLLALGKVINALGDKKRQKEGGHVPYRDSKLTRLLQDSLGGNSKTVMIACVSPANSNAEETLTTLKYANRARNIQNKAVINRDPVAAQMQRLQNQVEQMQAEQMQRLQNQVEQMQAEQMQMQAKLLVYRLQNQVEQMQAELLVYRRDNIELQRELQQSRDICVQLSQRVVDAEAENDQLKREIELIRKDEVKSTFEQEYDLVQEVKDGQFVDSVDLDDDGFQPKSFHEEHKYDLRKRERSLRFDDMDFYSESEDDEWAESGKKRKVQSNSGKKGFEVGSTSETHCCCSWHSSCKTTKCSCKASGTTCSSSCKCVRSRCSNRAGSNLQPSEIAEAE